MKFSLRLNNDHPVSTYIELAQIAEEAGFSPSVGDPCVNLLHEVDFFAHTRDYPEMV